MDACVVCSAPLRGRQEKFCGRKCKNRHTNYHHQSYERQREDVAPYAAIDATTWLWSFITQIQRRSSFS